MGRALKSGHVLEGSTQWVVARGYMAILDDHVSSDLDIRLLDRDAVLARRNRC